jgi:hypothetical protein
MNMIDLLKGREIEQFIHDGFIRIENAFSLKVAETVVDRLWSDLPCDRYDSSTWVNPVICLGMYTDQPFIDSLNTEILYSAFNLIGRRGQMVTL